MNIPAYWPCLRLQIPSWEDTCVEKILWATTLQIHNKKICLLSCSMKKQDSIALPNLICHGARYRDFRLILSSHLVASKANGKFMDKVKPIMGCAESSGMEDPIQKIYLNPKGEPKIPEVLFLLTLSASADLGFSRSSGMLTRRSKSAPDGCVLAIGIMTLLHQLPTDHLEVGFKIQQILSWWPPFRCKLFWRPNRFEHITKPYLTNLQIDGYCKTIAVFGAWILKRVQGGNSLSLSFHGSRFVHPSVRHLPVIEWDPATRLYCRACSRHARRRSWSRCKPDLQFVCQFAETPLFANAGRPKISRKMGAELHRGSYRVSCPWCGGCWYPSFSAWGGLCFACYAHRNGSLSVLPRCLAVSVHSLCLWFMAVCIELATLQCLSGCMDVLLVIKGVQLQLHASNSLTVWHDLQISPWGMASQP